MTHLFAYEITDEMKEEYVDLIYSGYGPDVAAKEIGSTGHQFRKHRRPRSQYYDADFAARVATALDSEEHRLNALERLRGQREKAREDGNIRMIEKESYAKDPEWEPLRHQNFHHDYDIKILARYLSEEQLDAAIAAAEAEAKEPVTLRALPPAQEEA